MKKEELQAQYRLLSELETMFPGDTKHHVYDEITKKMEDILTQLYKSEMDCIIDDKNILVFYDQKEISVKKFFNAHLIIDAARLRIEKNHTGWSEEKVEQVFAEVVERYESIGGKSLTWDELAQNLYENFGCNLVEGGDENNPYDWRLEGVTVTDVVNFLKKYGNGR